MSAVMCIALLASTTVLAQDSTPKKETKAKTECTKKDAAKSCCTKDKKEEKKDATKSCCTKDKKETKKDTAKSCCTKDKKVEDKKK